VAYILRKQIHKQVAMMLTELDTTGSNVFQFHIYLIDTAELQDFCIYSQDELIELGAKGNHQIYNSNMTLIVDDYAQSFSNLDSVLDQIGKRFRSVW
jgi:hypothetical protein